MTRSYRNTIDLIQASKSVESNCNAITFLNKGTASAKINGMPLLPGEMISFAGLQDEIDITKYNVSYDSAGSKAIFVLRKIYNDNSPITTSTKLPKSRSF